MKWKAVAAYVSLCSYLGYYPDPPLGIAHVSTLCFGSDRGARCLQLLTALARAQWIEMLQYGDAIPWCDRYRDQFAFQRLDPRDGQPLRWRHGGSFWLDRRILDQLHDIRPNGLALYAFLIYQAQGKPVVTVGHRKIETVLGISRGNLNDPLERLEGSGLVRRENRRAPGHIRDLEATNRYHFL